MWLWVGFVSSLDTYYTVLYRDHMQAVEENPVARMIMSSDNWDVSRFIGIKMFFTLLVLGVLACGYWLDRGKAYITLFFISLFQTYLICYLLGVV